ncbi:LysE/ArgO family amino acid transporter [Pseudorhodoferax sp. Leaf267]|uniref:LysE/ArgO family amino acid transporter n=1 Tax=Pseudorhodoferax sp. Leaf267 TaxID=1736316 RepID=UPI0006F761A8|nr:LysE family transporter [Pseudorhodoferax sp. Leaf267]KQP20499.1 amino acid transporter [Pseudorhodoferax sp. Leaf267]
MSAFLQGFALSLTLIVAIGAQNAFVLRQGLQRAHVLPVVLWCALADAVLVAAGVYGLAGVLGAQPMLARALAAVGAVFLAGYGLRALWRSRRPSTLQAAMSAPPGRAAVMAQAVAFTLLNPHVYLDTVLLVGTVGAQHAPLARAAFVAGAAVASAGWFTALGFGARWLAPVFARPRAWQWLDAALGVTMLVLAAGLVAAALG